MSRALRSRASREHALGRVVVLVRDADLDRLLRLENLLRRREVGEPVDLPALLGDLVRAFEVLDQHDQLVALVIPEGNLGRGGAGELCRLVREGTQNLAQFKGRRELVRDVEQRLKPVCRSHTGLIGIRGETLESGYDRGISSKEGPCKRS